MSAKHGSTLAAQWASYERLVIPATAGDLQRQETRRAFYAGAQDLFELLQHGVSAGPEFTAEDERLLEAVDAELRQFVLEVKEGRA